MAGQRSPITSAASRAAIGLRPRAVRANRMHRARFAIGKCSRKMNRFPVAIAAAVWMVSTTIEIMSKLGTCPVTSLRRPAVTQMAASMAHRPASRPASDEAMTSAGDGQPERFGRVPADRA